MYTKGKLCLHFRALTHKANGHMMVSVELLVSICCSSFFGVSCTNGAIQPLLAVFQRIQHVESASEPVSERNHSNWQLSSVHRKRKGREEKRLKSTGCDIETNF